MPQHRVRRATSPGPVLGGGDGLEVGGETAQSEHFTREVVPARLPSVRKVIEVGGSRRQHGPYLRGEIEGTAGGENLVAHHTNRPAGAGEAKHRAHEVALASALVNPEETAHAKDVRPLATGPR